MSQQIIDFDTNSPVAADEYEQMARLALPGYEVMHTFVLASLRSYLSETANLLVVGAGGGMELVRLGQGNPQWQFLGVDPSAKMLAIAQQKIAQHQLSQRIKLIQGYVQDLPNTPVYDAGTSILVMHFIPDEDSKLTFLQSIAQRLKTSALFILVDVFGTKGSPELEQTIATLHAYWKETGFPIDRHKQLLENFNNGVYPLSEAKTLELLQQAGFSHVIRFYTGLWVGGWMAFKG
ncbi:class I SAM-dependent methyltransferase [Nostoc sp. FACHB-892]|uniref:class I SAM-dependent methyltransferase n=1 Tax=Nostoc sp. FACHB-892 TaxID=2692843 RepID=UPI00168276A0|nr:class I SAM-dependent methyltransferase [Nostoc sp. FACHB-892]MBD2726054.1 class I SAM-dependent methyltransferase [Nostoc sp. FACHB-892]